jgi:hypothetical protein
MSTRVLMKLNAPGGGVPGSQRMPFKVKQCRALLSISSAKLDSDGSMFIVGIIGGVDDPPLPPAPAEPVPTKPGVVMAKEPFGLKVTVPLSGSGTLRQPLAPPGPHCCGAAGTDCAHADVFESGAENRRSPVIRIVGPDEILSIPIDPFHLPRRRAAPSNFPMEVVDLLNQRSCVRT